MRYDIPPIEGDAAKRYAAQDDALWRWVAAVLREEHRRQQYAEDMFPQVRDEIRQSRRALLDAAVSCEYRAGRIPITPVPPFPPFPSRQIPVDGP
jgi:hypothetical protein